MNKTLKYLISIFLAFAMIASDCTLGSQSKSADYYQSSFVILRRELEGRNSRLYVFNKFVSGIKIAFSIPVTYLEFKQLSSFQVGIIQKTQNLLHQNISSFIRQSVFVNELITCNNLYKSLYSA
ncbi:hypothetical protein [Flavobacterium sp. MEB061]|uniref:hypothetical protein n=1 Tax=Flavobacterium sp. MEB061 TaxID=1587524 RepID=UPI001040689D|nr:hypothetical protein [Flavobacterium sp. MEB061]